YFDGVFLNELDRNEWESTLKWVQSKLTDEVIHNAIMKMPPEIYAIRGKEIELKLKGRRDDLHQMGMKYYKFISEEVNVSGTEDEEIFKISGNKEKLLVQVFAKKQGKGERKIYERVFYGETRIINLQGLAGKDDFQIVENTVSNIQLNLSGGEGEDKYDIKGSVNNAIIDNKGELNTIINKSNSRIQIK
ncbi:MAG TPA: metallophosphoesterase, partial [Chitinophagaceae bacterium]